MNSDTTPSARLARLARLGWALASSRAFVAQRTLGTVTGETTTELSTACSRNLATAFKMMIPHVGSSLAGDQRFGRVDAIATGLPIAFYNPVLITETGAVERDIEAAVRWVRQRGLPVSAQVRLDLLPDVDPVLTQLGLSCDEPPTPGMALHPIPAHGPANVRVERVTSATFDDWHAGIDYGPRFRQAFVASLVEDPAFHFVVAYDGAEPVAGAAAIVSAGVVGIYAVGTVARARRRGLGTAVTWAAIDAGVEAGAGAAILQSSEIGESVYRAMGFREVCRYSEYYPGESTHP